MISQVRNTFLDASEKLETQAPVELTAGSKQAVEETVNGSTTDQQVNVAFDNTLLKSIWICADVDMTLKTNSTSASIKTFTLKANVPVLWESSSGYYANPFSAAVTNFYATNAGSTAGVLRIRVHVDPTP